MRNFKKFKIIKRNTLINEIGFFLSHHIRLMILIFSIAALTIVFSINSPKVNNLGSIFNFDIFINVIVITVFLIVYLFFFSSNYLKSTTHLWFITIMSVIFYAASKFLYFNQEQYFIPVITYISLISIFINQQTAFISLAISIILLTNLVGINISTLIPLLSGGFIASYISRNIESRTQIANTSIIIGFIQAFSFILTYIILNKTFSLHTNTIIQANIWFIAGIILGLATVGVIPFIEETFGLITPTRLAELSDFTQPALTELEKRAPGTFQHSLAVSSLAENAAKAIGANSSLCRVGAYYHDLGKMQKPHYFIENQIDYENPHDKLNNPVKSAGIIIAHTKAGLAIAKKYRIPGFLHPFIIEHHGTDLVGYFYYQAIKQDSSSGKEKFCYHGPPPQSRETAIVMLADSCEASTRSLEQITRSKVTSKVKQVISSKIINNQLIYSNLSKKDIGRLINSFTETILEIHHRRIKYPE